MLLDMQTIVGKSKELSSEAFDTWVRGYVKDLVLSDFKAKSPDVEFYEAHITIQFDNRAIQNFADHMLKNVFDDMGGQSAYSSSLLMLEYIYMLDPDRVYYRDKSELSPFMRQLTVALATTGTLLSFNDPERYELWSGWWDAYNQFLPSFKSMDRAGHFDRIPFTKELVLLGESPEEPETPRTIIDWLADGIKEVHLSDIMCWQGTLSCTCTPILYDLEKERFTQFMIAGMWELSSICQKCADAIDESDQLVDNMAKGRWVSGYSFKP